MTKEQLIEIAKVSFPDRVKQFIDFDNLEMFHMSGVYRLYEKDSPFPFMIPEQTLMSIFIGEDKFIQIQVENKAFNHYAAIKKLEEFKII